jgi:hypothetical protein
MVQQPQDPLPGACPGSWLYELSKVFGFFNKPFPTGTFPTGLSQNLTLIITVESVSGGGRGPEGRQACPSGQDSSVAL